MFLTLKKGEDSNFKTSYYFYSKSIVESCIITFYRVERETKIV